MDPFDRHLLQQKEDAFVNWCRENEQDPTDPQARQSYAEENAETGEVWWDGLSKEDRDGYESMMTDE